VVVVRAGKYVSFYDLAITEGHSVPKVVVLKSRARKSMERPWYPEPLGDYQPLRATN